jgi:predicted dehydrogenase
VSTGRWSAFCVVGLGGHTNTKLLPAIAGTGQQLAGVVSRKSGPAPKGVPTFPDVAAALQALPPETAFILASPPGVHFRQAMTLLDAGRDVIIEKPAFVSAQEAIDATAAATRNGSVLLEAFMHRYTELYRCFTAAWHEQARCIEAMEISFLLPAVPGGTFRDDAAVESSLLYDVGCYAVSLVADLGLPLGSLELVRVNEAGDPLAEQYRIESRSEGVGVVALLGIGTEYCNEIVLKGPSGTVRYSPFFYGRPGTRSIERRGPTMNETESFVEANAFERMLATPTADLRADQPVRLRQMIEVTRCLELLGRELGGHRARAAQRGA